MTERSLQNSESSQIDKLPVAEVTMKNRHPEYFYFTGMHYEIEDMIKNNFIKETDGKWAAVPERLKVATSFIEYVELLGATSV